LEYRCPDGDLRQLQVIGAPLCGDATVTGSVIVVADETARCRAEAELTRLAVTDALTGLPNRAALHDRLGQALSRRRRQQSVLAVLFLDLDGFKSVNDRFGHAAGDQVLREVHTKAAPGSPTSPQSSGPRCRSAADILSREGAARPVPPGPATQPPIPHTRQPPSS